MVKMVKMVKEGRASMRSHLIICAATMGLVLGFAASGEATTYTFTKIAETSSAPNGFSALNIPSLSDNGTAAFSARLNSTLIGIFIGEGTTTPNPIVDTSGPSSNFGFSFTILGSPSINNTGMVAFWARLNDGSNGIFTSDGTTAMTIAGPFTSLSASSPSINDAGAVAFQANLNIFTGSGGSTTTIADTSGRFSSLNFPSITNTGTVAFQAFLDAGGSGIFMGDGTTTTTVVASGTFTALSFPFANNGGTVTFLGFLNGGGSGIFSSNGGTLTSIADTSGPFTFFGTPSINDAGVVAFQAFISTGAGIFSGPDPIADRVIAVGDPLDGSTVAGLAFSREGLNGAGQVAFFVSLADGRQGVFLADPGDGGDPMPTPDPVPLPVPSPDPDLDPVNVTIDIKPNSMNLGSKGTTPVVIFSTDTFDATTVDPTTVQLEGSEVRKRGNGASMASYSDFNGDGRLDLMVHVETEYLQQPTSATETDQIDLTLTGKTWLGATITGSDSVRIVP
jgi:hypothetical protein